MLCARRFCWWRRHLLHCKSQYHLSIHYFSFKIFGTFNYYIAKLGENMIRSRFLFEILLALMASTLLMIYYTCTASLKTCGASLKTCAAYLKPAACLKHVLLVLKHVLLVLPSHPSTSLLPITQQGPTVITRLTSYYFFIVCDQSLYFNERPKLVSTLQKMCSSYYYCFVLSCDIKQSVNRVTVTLVRRLMTSPSFIK